MVNPLPFVGKAIGGLFGGLGRFGWFVVGNKFGRNGTLILLVLLAFLLTPIKTSIDEGSFEPVIQVIITRLASGDNGIDQEITELKANSKRKNMDLLKSALKIAGLFYFSFYLLAFAFWKIADLQDNSADLRNILFAIFMIIALQITGSIYLLSKGHEGSFGEDIEYIIGEKSLLETIAFLNPIKGIINLVKNLTIFLEPIAKIVEKLYI